MKKLKGAVKRILGGLQNRLSKLARFGQSKHEAKQAARAAYLKEHGNLDGYNPARVDGIFSIGTMETYRADRKSTRLNSSHRHTSRMPSSA